LRDTEHHEKLVKQLSDTIATAPLGDTLDSTASLAKRHDDDVEKSVAVVSEKSVQLETAAQSLISTASIDTTLVAARREATIQSMAALLAASKDRRTALSAATEYVLSLCEKHFFVLMPC
jgi:hypothetical protein